MLIRANIFLMNGQLKNWARHWSRSASGTSEGHRCFPKFSLCDESYIIRGTGFQLFPVHLDILWCTILRYVQSDNPVAWRNRTIIVPLFLVDHQLYCFPAPCHSDRCFTESILLILRRQTVVFVECACCAGIFFQRNKSINNYFTPGMFHRILHLRHRKNNTAAPNIDRTFP